MPKTYIPREKMCLFSIKNKQTSIVPGELGKRDVKIIAAVYEAMRTGKKVIIK